MTILLLVSIAVALMGTLVTLGLWALHERHDCPVCGSWTQAVRPTLWLRLTRLPVSPRWCLVCGWEGYARARSTTQPPESYVVFRWGRRRPPVRWEHEASRRPRRRPRAAPPDDPFRGWTEEE